MYSYTTLSYSMCFVKINFTDLIESIALSFFLSSLPRAHILYILSGCFFFLKTFYNKLFSRVLIVEKLVTFYRSFDFQIINKINADWQSTRSFSL